MFMFRHTTSGAPDRGHDIRLHHLLRLHLHRLRRLQFPLLAMPRGGDGTTRVVTTPALERKVTRSVAVAQLCTEEAAARAPARPSVAGVGAQSAGPASTTQQQGGGPGGASTPDL
jgi:hypothetical protein